MTSLSGVVGVSACLGLMSVIFLIRQIDGAAQTSYFPQELHSAAIKLSSDDIRSFIHAATFLQNSNVMGLETKVPSLNVMTALRNFGASKVGDYFRTLLRMWAKFSKEDRIKNKEEMFRNIDSLKIPIEIRSAMKAMFEHVDGLQKVIVSAARTTTAAPTTTTTTTVAVTEENTEEANSTTSIFEAIASEYGTTAAPDSDPSAIV
ncbi:hypothetical protein BV898_03475 [Hypsibius exemplaris]|uniref:Uncharacterized protein n=1 Tax=Hypsibius exemplaris TaxID=2072580 RepID=A0A1W0X5M9_HYPEX|nr:hypothetical protein BV898_03475 [Hypsibius exemplaris]